MLSLNQEKTKTKTIQQKYEKIRIFVLFTKILKSGPQITIQN